MSSIQGFRNRAQIGELAKALDDALGNADGIPSNEQGRAGWVPRSVTLTQPLLHRLLASAELGLSAVDEANRLVERVKLLEAECWGGAVSTLPAATISDGEAFRIEKAAALLRFDRAPSEVTEGFVTASGKVNGQHIAPREVFWQRWAAKAPASGKVVVVSPGFQETGRNFYEQIAMLNRAHHEVIVMDHQWAGYTKGGEAGGLDRGFGVARDVAAVAAFAQKWADGEFKDKPHEVVLMGNSMGAGPGVLSASVLNDAGKLQLDGEQMPKGLKMILQAPFLEMTPGLLNQGLAMMSHAPFHLNEVAMPSMGIPKLTTERGAQAKLASHLVKEDIRAQPRAMTAADADLAVVKELIASDGGPKGRLYVIHGVKDPLAHCKASEDLVHGLGYKRAHILRLEMTDSHVLEESRADNAHILEALHWLDRDAS
jgi:alpha-beta hydrolase superfamily lysophospholipase